MSKVKYLTKGDWLFVIVLLGCLIYSFFTSKSSTLLLFFQALATAGCYFILKKDLIPKNWNQKGKNNCIIHLELYHDCIINSYAFLLKR